ncbi:alginate lyase family protein [Litorimonas sp.]|uniref:alginate lyase family protein n=1 Tax=Litorimonas sp. TaxID=1892381 RepID=UPI003A8BD073
MISKLWAYRRLGVRNVIRVAVYRTGLRLGLHLVLLKKGSVPVGPFFRLIGQDVIPAAAPPNNDWDASLLWFGWYRRPQSDAPPDWFANPFSDTLPTNADLDWWRIPDFNAGDIKGIWELSRFDWVIAWATKAAHGDMEALEKLNLWLGDWARSNPPYKGPNWKCGQEASIRVMHLCLAAWLLNQDTKPEPGLVQLLVCHLKRIAPTMSYAIGQANNHGTSEAAALFIGGTFLARHHPDADTWARKGRHWLEERAQNLIEPDGSFSQHSVNYHRVMLDTYSLAEAWRRHRSLPEFSQHLRIKLASAAIWLYALVDPVTGDAPNIGANDGARLIQLTDSDYRDFRPSVQLAMALFHQERCFEAGHWDDTLAWLHIPLPDDQATPPSRSFDDGGYHVLRQENTLAVLRYPRFRFRPSQADALHLDLWREGRNLLRDGGTFSYNADGAEWFGGTSAHNTITFDGRDQMPRLGRFLFGDWIKAEAVECVSKSENAITAAAAYTDHLGAHHYRKVMIDASGMTCIDKISGKFDKACLRWRLEPANWKLDGNTLLGGSFKLTVEADKDLIEPLLGTTRESRYYQACEEVPLLSVSFDRPTTITTRVLF